MNNVLTKEFFLVAGEADAQCELPLTTLAMRLIEVASLHANHLGFGHAEMAPHNLGWVLSRLSVEMTHYPAINRAYSISTWIEGWNRHYSERVFEIRDVASDTVLGYARTIWMVIDTEQRTGATTESMAFTPDMIAPRECPMPSMRRIPVVKPDAEGATVTPYTYRYSDIDFYRHVNTTKHIRTIIDTCGMELMDRCHIARADFAFMNEGHYDETVRICRLGDIWRVIGSDDRTILTARLAFAPR